MKANCLRFSALVAVLLAAFAPAVAIAASATETVSSAKRIAILSAIDSSVRFQKVGFTAFQNETWTTTETGFDINEAALAAAQKCLKREAKFVKGSTLVPPDEMKALTGSREQLEPLLNRLAPELDVDVVIVIHGIRTRDWIGRTNQSIENVGIYNRGPRWEAYCALGLQTFHCATRRLGSSEKITLGQAIPRVAWRTSWPAYGDAEKRLVLHGLRTVIEDGIPTLLAKAGLAEPRVKEKSVFEKALGSGRGKSWVPDGDGMEIPSGISKAAARLVVATAFMDRGWTISSKDAEKIVAVLPKGKIEAVATATVTERTITLVSERFETKGDGTRAKLDPNVSWHRNLKDSIVRGLLRAAPDQ